MKKTPPNDEASAHLYEWIYQDLERKIVQGEIPDGAQIPPLRDLCAEYEVSTSSVRRALGDLERNGLISKHRGRGTFAIGKRARRDIYVLLAGKRWDLYRTPMKFIAEVFDILAGIRDTAREEGQADVTLISQALPETLPPADAGTTAGYLLIAMYVEDDMEVFRQAQRQGIPIVLVNAPVPVTPCVRVDMEEGVFLGVEHLIRQGHRRIGYIGRGQTEWYSPRLMGYYRALAQNGLRSDPELVALGNTESEDEAAMDRLLALPEPATAVFVEVDHRALHLLQYARRQGIAVPEQISICGYDDFGDAARAQPPLTTVHHPCYEIGQEAVRLLSRLMDGEPPGKQDIVLPTHVVVRASTAPPAPGA